MVSVSKVEEVGNDGFLPPSFKVQKSTLIRISKNKFHQDFYNQFEDSPFREESNPPTWEQFLAVGGGTAVKHSAHNPAIKGSNLTAGTGIEKMINKNFL